MGKRGSVNVIITERGGLPSVDYEARECVGSYAEAVAFFETRERAVLTRAPGGHYRATFLATPPPPVISHEEALSRAPHWVPGYGAVSASSGGLVVWARDAIRVRAAGGERDSREGAGSW